MKQKIPIDQNEARKKLKWAAFIAYIFAFGLIGVPLSMYSLFTNPDISAYQEFFQHVWFGSGILALIIHMKGSKSNNDIIALIAMVAFGVCALITVVITEIYSRLFWKKYQLTADK